MVKRSLSLSVVGYGLFVIYGVGLILYLASFIYSFINQEAIIHSPLFLNKFHSLAEFRTAAVIFWILFFPQCIGLASVLRLKEQGRRFVIIMNVILCAYLMTRMIFMTQMPVSRDIVVIITSVLIILFFQWRNIREQFIKAGHMEGKNILVVDDDKGLLRMMKVNLSSHGFNVLTALTGEKGLTIAKKVRPQLIILDVILPGMKGREVCAKLKNDPHTKNIPIIFLTAKNSPDDVQAELELGAASHLTKPIDTRQVITEINKILNG